MLKIKIKFIKHVFESLYNILALGIKYEGNIEINSLPYEKVEYK